jgi:hypothetical protein
MRSDQVDPQKEAIGQLGEYLPRVLETRDRPVPYPLVVRHPAQRTPNLFEIEVFVDAASNP